MQFSYAHKSLLLFVAPILAFIILAGGEELSGISLNELGLTYVYDITRYLGLALWGVGVLFALYSFYKKEGHFKKAFAGVFSNIFLFLAFSGALGNYL